MRQQLGMALQALIVLAAYSLGAWTALTVEHHARPQQAAPQRTLKMPPPLDLHDLLDREGRLPELTA